MYLYTFNTGDFRKQEVTVDKNNFINGETPFEDYGDAMLLDADIPVDEAFEQWRKYLESAEEKIDYCIGCKHVNIMACDDRSPCMYCARHYPLETMRRDYYEAVMDKEE
jgi:hypothetical protein